MFRYSRACAWLLLLPCRWISAEVCTVQCSRYVVLYIYTYTSGIKVHAMLLMHCYVRTILLLRVYCVHRRSIYMRDVLDFVCTCACACLGVRRWSGGGSASGFFPPLYPLLYFPLNFSFGLWEFAHMLDSYTVYSRCPLRAWVEAFSSRSDGSGGRRS